VDGGAPIGDNVGDGSEVFDGDGDFDAGASSVDGAVSIGNNTAVVNGDGSGVFIAGASSAHGRVSIVDNTGDITEVFINIDSSVDSCIVSVSSVDIFSDGSMGD